MNLGKRHGRAGYRVRSAIFLVVYFCLILIVLDGVSFAILASLSDEKGKGEIERSVLLEKFPAQFLLSRQEIRAEFSNFLPIDYAGQHLTFIFDPVIGYRSPDSLEWYGSRGTDDQEFVILCLGGSTTEGDNWPRYLREYAQLAGASDEIVVINAGVGGYTTFTEKLLFSEWVWPELKKLGVHPDLVITLDGVNDVWYRILSYQFAQQKKAPIWLSRYHGYHQKLSSDITDLTKLSSALNQALVSSINSLKNSLVVVLPYTMKIVETLSKSLISNFTMSGDGSNLSKKHSSLPELSESVEHEIIDAFKGSLMDLHGLAEVRSVESISYLQPVLVNNYYPHPIPETITYPGINWFGQKLTDSLGFWSDLYDSGPIKTDRMYAMSEKLYLNLNKRFPGHYQSLIDLFYDDPEVTSLYEEDGVHYGNRGKRKIAEAIVSDLVTKGILTID